MKAQEVFQELGNMISHHYSEYHFRYMKSSGVKKKTKNHEYVIYFSSFPGNTQSKVSINVGFKISYHSKKIIEEDLLRVSLWDLGYYYETDRDSIDTIAMDIIKHANILFIPCISLFEDTSSRDVEEFITQGFLGRIPGHLYHYPDLESELLDYTTHKHYWIGTDFLKHHNEFGFTISLPYIFERFGKESAQLCLDNYLHSLNPISRESFFSFYYAEKNDEPWK